MFSFWLVVGVCHAKKGYFRTSGVPWIQGLVLELCEGLILNVLTPTLAACDAFCIFLLLPGDFRWWTLRPHSAETVLSRSRGTIAAPIAPVHFHTGRHGIPWATGESSRALPLGSCSLHPWSWDHAQANGLLHQRTACSASDVHIPKSSGAWRNLCSKDSKLPVRVKVRLFHHVPRCQGSEARKHFIGTGLNGLSPW